MRDNSYSR